MEERQAGVTALVTAYSRAYHATHVSPMIFNDFLADALFSAEEHAFFNKSLASLLPLIDAEMAAACPDEESALAAVMRLQTGPVTISRSRFTEDTLEAAIQNGASQYVILGAGFDTFAFRRPDLAEKLAVFEVDHPVTQEMKRQRAAAAGLAIPANLHFVPVDFSRESLAEALLRPPYSPQQSSFFNWLGVTYYLSREVVFDTLRCIARTTAKGSQVVFDYLDCEAFDPEKASGRVRLMRSVAQQAGEPMKAGFDPRLLASELEPLGFRLVENLGPDEIEARYFQGRSDDYHAFEHVHLARVELTG